MLLVLVFFAATFAQSDVAATVSSLMDWSVDPCDDFWLYSCGSWIKNTTLPPTKPRLTRSFTEIGDHNQEILKGVVEDPANSLLNTFFNSCMDMDSINAAGVQPLQQQLALLPSITDVPSLFAALAQLNLVGISPFFSFGATIDPGNPSRVTISFEQGGLGLPYPSLYSGQDDNSKKIRDAYSTFLQTVFTLIGDPQPALAAADAYRVEAAISAFTVPRDELNDPFVTYNPMSFNYFQQLSPLPWALFLDALKISVVGNITVSVPGYYQNISRVIPHLQNQWIPYLKSAILRAGAPALSQPFRDAYFKFYSQVLGGQSQPEPLWRQCISRTDGLMGELTGKYFLQLAFPGSSLSAATEDLQGIIKSMQEDIINIPWMDSVTRTRALQKLSLVVNMIGGPSNPRTYNDVNITKAYFANVVNLRSSSVVLELKTIGQGSQEIRNDWQMSPATVNAYYDPTRNQMVFPAGILQQPFFNNSFPIEMNLGGIGMVMGHELTHGFDNQGRLYDGTGRLTNWWQPDTSKLFDKKVQCVIDQYSQFQPLPGVFVNGKLTQGENIADMGGIKNAFATARTMLGDAGLASPSIVPKLAKGQLFFVAFAQTWCTISSPEYIKLQVQTDPHSPAQYRVLGPLINLPEFSQTFQCPVGSRMNPPQRCEVW